MLHAAATLDKSVTGCIENCDRVSRPCSMVTRLHTADNAAPLQYCSTAAPVNITLHTLKIFSRSGGVEEVRGAWLKSVKFLLKLIEAADTSSQTLRQLSGTGREQTTFRGYGV